MTSGSISCQINNDKSWIPVGIIHDPCVKRNSKDF